MKPNKKKLLIIFVSGISVFYFITSAYTDRVEESISRKQTYSNPVFRNRFVLSHNVEQTEDPTPLPDELSAITASDLIDSLKGISAADDALIFNKWARAVLVGWSNPFSPPDLSSSIHLLRTKLLSMGADGKEVVLNAWKDSFSMCRTKEGQCLWDAAKAVIPIDYLMEFSTNAAQSTEGNMVWVDLGERIGSEYTTPDDVETAFDRIGSGIAVNYTLEGMLGKPELLSIPVLEIMSQWADSTKTHDGIRKILSERNLKPGHK